MTTPEQRIADEISILRQDSEDILVDIAAKEAELAEAGGEAEPSPTPEATPTPAPASNPILNTQAELVAEINRLDSEGKHVETGPLKSRLLAIAGGMIGTSQPTPTPAEANAALPTRAELDRQIAEAEASGNWSASGALKSRIIQGQFR